MNFTFYFKYKKQIINILIFFAIFFLLSNSKILVTSISGSINMFLFKLVPSLFPYLLITELLMNSNKIYDLSYGVSKLLSIFFRIPRYTTSIVIVGLLLGYPNAAKCISKMYHENKIDEKLATKLIVFTSNANPAYILATIGLGMFQSIEIGIILAISHYLSAIIIGSILSPSYNNNIIQQTNINSNSFVKISSPFELLSNSIMGSIKTLAYIFAYTTIFSLIPTVIFSNIHMQNTIKAIIIGIFEISNGINEIQLLNISLNSKILFTSFVLSFSSLMIIMQIFSFAFKAKIKFKVLLKYKLLQGAISCIITHIILKYLYIPATSVSVNLDSFTWSYSVFPIHLYVLLLILILFLLLTRKKRQAKPVA